MDTRAIQNLAVVSVDEAGRIGRVADVLFETSPLRAAALQLRSERGDLVVPWEDLRSVGRDAVTVQSANAARSPATLRNGDLPGLEDLQRLKVVDEAGTLVGTVYTVDIDPQTGAAISMVTERGGLLGLGTEHRTISVEAIRGIGREIVTVRTSGDATR